MTLPDTPIFHSVLTPFIRKSEGFTEAKTPYIGPSNLINMCEREWAIQTNTRQTILWPFETLMTFLSGFIVEDAMKRILHKAGITVLSEQLHIPVGDLAYTSKRGRSDQIIKFDDEQLIKTENGSIVLLEIKKMAPWRFNNFKKLGLESESAAHFQLLQYLKKVEFVEKLTFPKPDFGILVGFQLEPMDMFDIRVDYTDEAWEKFVPRLEAIHEVKENNGRIIPDRPYYKNSFQCRSCSVFDVCWDVADEKLDFNSLETAEKVTLREKALDYIDAAHRERLASSDKETLREWIDIFMTDKDVSEMEIPAGLEILSAKIAERLSRKVYKRILEEEYPEIFAEVAPVEFNDSLTIRTRFNPKAKIV